MPRAHCEAVRRPRAAARAPGFLPRRARTTVLIAGAGPVQDANGNQTTGYGAKTMSYDGENRPLAVTYAGTTTSYVYGPDGQRLKMIVSGGSGTATTLHAGDVEIRNYGQGSSEIVTRHADTTVREVNGTQSLLARDHLASVLLVTDDTGLAARTTSYVPYGEIADETVLNAAVETESKGFIGERYDTDAGLQYLNARYYDPALALFIQPDWFEVTEQGVGTNRYMYSFGDPINLSDPGGNETYDPDSFAGHDDKQDVLEDKFDDLRSRLDESDKGLEELLANDVKPSGQAQKDMVAFLAERSKLKPAEVTKAHVKALLRENMLERRRVGKPGEGILVIYGGPNAAAGVGEDVLATAPTAPIFRKKS